MSFAQWKKTLVKLVRETPWLMRKHGISVVPGDNDLYVWYEQNVSVEQAYHTLVERYKT